MGKERQVKAISRSVATVRLTNRWREQVERYPVMRNEIPLALYVSRNLAHVMRGGLLERYDRV